MTLALRYAVRSDVGLVRSDNQDAVYAGPRLLALADGMGGHVGGGTASRVVIGTFAPLDEDVPPQDVLSMLRDTVHSANERLREVVQSEPGLDGMGTTLTAMFFSGGRLGVVHIGDSRAYVLQGRKFSQVTRDQTFVQALVDEGRITEEEARNHPQRSVILRALTGSEVDPDLSIREAHLGDRYLICSDGLSDYVSGDTIAETLRRPDPHAAADRLVELALRAGGRDNITVIVADIVDAQDGDDEPIIDGAASDTVGDREVHPTSAAARAAIAIPPGQADHDPQQIESADSTSGHPGRVRRRLVVAVGALVVIMGGLAGLYEWSQAQYFVGASDSRVTVFKGINLSLAGARLYHPVHTSDLAVDDLVSTARDKVRSGLSADSRSGADKIISNLNKGELLPLCSPLATAPPSPSHPPSAGRPSGHATATRSIRATPRPTERPTPRPTARRTTTRSTRPTHAATTQPTLTVTVPTPVPGKDCR